LFVGRRGNTRPLNPSTKMRWRKSVLRSHGRLESNCRLKLLIWLKCRSDPTQDRLA